MLVLTAACCVDGDSFIGNRIGDTGARAIAGALSPRKASDGSWVHPGQLEYLDLSGECPYHAPVSKNLDLIDASSALNDAALTAG